MLKSEYRVIGLMSGTSLDGLDLCYCSLKHTDNRWSYSIHRATTMTYSQSWLGKLQFRTDLSAQQLLQLNQQYGQLLADYLQQFMTAHSINASEVDLIASHGHTLYHQPAKGFTYQLGGGPEIFSRSGIATITDFRSQDLALGGQGAPLVPLADRLLFGDYPACLNLGGFANISFEYQEKRIAFDICPVNFVLNKLAAKLGLDYDKNGELARTHQADQPLLDQLNQLDYYNRKPPKSLGAEWVHQHIYPLFKDLPPQVLLATCTEHSARQIAAVLNQYKLKKCLLSGGGVFNSWLIDRIKTHCHTEIVVPDKDLINYKEALAFALLGVLKLRHEPNVLASVTGASRDHSAGHYYS